MGLSGLRVFRNGKRLLNGHDFAHKPGSDVVTLLKNARTGDVFEFVSGDYPNVISHEKHTLFFFFGQRVFRLGFCST